MAKSTGNVSYDYFTYKFLSVGNSLVKLYYIQILWITYEIL